MHPFLAKQRRGIFVSMADVEGSRVGEEEGKERKQDKEKKPFDWPRTSWLSSQNKNQHDIVVMVTMVGMVMDGDDG
jgi:hypothetical protein